MSFFNKIGFTSTIRAYPQAVMDCSLKEVHTDQLPSAGIQTAIVRGTRAIRFITSRQGEEQNRYSSTTGFLDLFNDAYNYATRSQSTIYMYQGSDGRFHTDHGKPTEITFIEITPVGHVSINYTPHKEVTKTQIQNLPLAKV